MVPPVTLPGRVLPIRKHKSITDTINWACEFSQLMESTSANVLIPESLPRSFHVLLESENSFAMVLHCMTAFLIGPLPIATDTANSF